MQGNEEKIVLVSHEVEELKKKRTRYLLFALQNYSNALAIGNKHNNKVFRLISLW